MQENNTTNERTVSKHRRQIRVYIGMIVIILVTVVCDIHIRTASMPSLIVSDTYLDGVFAALCTVAVLGSAIQSIIIGSFNSKIHGLTVKEILAEIPNRINIARTVILSFVSIFVGLVFYTLNFCSVTTAVAICLIYIIAESSFQIWRLLSNQAVQKSVINDIIESSDRSPEFFYIRWFSDLKCALENNDEALVDDYVELIAKINNKETGQKNHSPSIEKNIRDVFPLASKRIGFVDAYKKIACLGEWRNDIVDTSSIIQAYLAQIQYSNEQIIGEYRVPETIDDILERMKIQNDEKERYAFWFYSSIKGNQIITKSIRNTIILDIYSRLCFLRDTADGELRKRVILHIFNRDILNNENIDERKELMLLLIECLHHNNRYSKDVCYISLIAQLFRALYFFSTYETDTLNADYREELKTLFQYGKTGKDKYKITLAGLISENSDNILKWLSDDCKTASFHRDRMFEYFSEDCRAKSVVWTTPRCALFAFKYYLLVGYHFRFFPISQIVEDDSIDPNYRTSLCQSIMSCFDDEGKLTKEFHLAVTKLQDFIGVNYSFENSFSSANFNYYNEKLSELSKKHYTELVSDVSQDLSVLNNKVAERCARFKGLQYCDTIDLNKAPDISIKPQIRHAVKDDIAFATERITWAVENVLNQMIGTILREKTISFDQNGVNTMLTELENGGYQARNCTFVDDLALKPEVKASEDYQKLVEVLKTIPFIKGSDLRQYVFIKKEQILFNAKVTSYHVDLPSEAQCEEYITSFKVADGKYRIDGAVLDYSKALDYVKNTYIVEYVEMRVGMNIDAESGFVVRYNF